MSAPLRRASLVLLGIAILTGWVGADARKDAYPVPIRGLAEIDLDRWTARIAGADRSARGNEAMPSEASLRDALERFGRSSDETAGLRELFAWMLAEAAPGPSLADWSSRAEILFKVRDAFRTQGKIEARRKANFLLELLVEEILYVAGKRLGSPGAAWIVKGDARACPLGEVPGDFYGLSVCLGDTAISKGESFSSSLDAFRAPLDAAYSHSAFIAPDPASGKPRLLEADGFGGSLNRYEEENPPARLSLYRVRPDADPGAKGIRAALSRAERLTERAGKLPPLPGGEPAPIFGFNITLDPVCADRYYCSELNYCLFHEAGVEEGANPLPKRIWTRQEDGSAFIDQVWPVYKGPIPLPPDLELNANYELVGHRIDFAGLPRLRIQFAVLNALTYLLETDSERRAAYLVELLRFGDTPIARTPPEIVERILKFGSLRRVDWDRMVKLLPPEITPKEVVFYYHVQHRLLPALEARLLTAENATRDPIPLGRLGAMALPWLRAEIDGFVARARSE